MRRDVIEQLKEDVKEELARSASSTFGILGHSDAAYDLVSLFREVGAEERLTGIYSGNSAVDVGSEPVKAFQSLRSDQPDAVVVASDARKEDLLWAALPYLRTSVTVFLAGYEHFGFRNAVFEDVVSSAIVPSLANGYENSLIHILQCLQNAARLNLNGIVAEFGISKGGTTMMLSRFIERLGRDWNVVGFDTFNGFPPKRSPLDMYSHPDCVFTDERAVRSYLSGRNVKLVKGDVVETIGTLADQDIVLGFFDTDNFSSTTAILDVVEDRVVPGGALIFDHFTSSGRFKYTIGERLAAKRLLADPRYFHLHGTGVFYRQDVPSD